MNHGTQAFHNEYNKVYSRIADSNIQRMIGYIEKGYQWGVTWLEGKELVYVLLPSGGDERMVKKYWNDGIQNANRPAWKKYLQP